MGIDGHSEGELSLPGAAGPQVGSVLAGGAGLRHDFLIVSWREATERHRRLRGRQSQLQNSHVEREATACSRQRQDRQSQLHNGIRVGREATACSRQRRDRQSQLLNGCYGTPMSPSTHPVGDAREIYQLACLDLVLML